MRCPTCGSHILSGPHPGDPELERAYYEANRRMRGYNGPVPSAEWTAIIEAQERVETKFVSSKRKPHKET